MQIASPTAVSGYPKVSEFQTRQGYLGALTAALRNGNVVAAQQALLGLSGVDGGLSPEAVFEVIKSALNSGKLEDMKTASSILDASRVSKQAGDFKDINKESKTPLSNDLMVASGTGKLVNIRV